VTRLPIASATAQQLEAARATLRGLELRLRPEHPDVARAKREVQTLERKVESELLDRPLAADASPARPLTGAEIAQQKRLSDLRVERDRIERQLVANAAEQVRLQGLVAAYRARVEAAPTREAELTELTRDYGTLQETYTSLLQKSQASDMATNLERRQIGQQFKIVEEARLPQRPISPDRPRMITMAGAAGLGFALVLIALLEYRDTTFKSDDDVLMSLALPVFAVIPAMLTVAERQQSARRRTMAWSASLAVGVCGAAVAVWRLGLIDAWVR
jgi:uncharacterized protein involved in exopolysaccharide biosynthesis